MHRIDSPDNKVEAVGRWRKWQRHVLRLCSKVLVYRAEGLGSFTAGIRHQELPNPTDFFF